MCGLPCKYLELGSGALLAEGMAFSQFGNQIVRDIHPQYRGATAASLVVACNPDDKLREQGIVGSMAAEQLQVGVTAGQKC